MDRKSLKEAGDRKCGGKKWGQRDNWESEIEIYVILKCSRLGGREYTDICYFGSFSFRDEKFFVQLGNSRQVEIELRNSREGKERKQGCDGEMDILWRLIEVSEPSLPSGGSLQVAAFTWHPLCHLVYDSLTKPSLPVFLSPRPRTQRIRQAGRDGDW